MTHGGVSVEDGHVDLVLELLSVLDGAVAVDDVVAGVGVGAAAGELDLM